MRPLGLSLRYSSVLCSSLAKSRITSLRSVVRKNLDSIPGNLTYKKDQATKTQQQTEIADKITYLLHKDNELEPVETRLSKIESELRR